MTLGYEAAIVVSSERARPAVSTSHSGAVAVLGAIAEGAALCLVSAGDQQERVQRDRDGAGNCLLLAAVV